MRGPEGRAKRHGQGLEDRDLAAEAARGGRHLRPDEPGADHDDPRRPVVSAARSARESSSVRSMWTPSSSGWPGSRRAVAPVAMTRPS